MKAPLRVLLLLSIAICTLLSGCGENVISEQPESAEIEALQGLTITALPVGKADALLVQSDGCSALIDTGETETAGTILEALRQHGIEKLDLLLITHFDKDHVGGAPAVLKAVAVDRICYPDYEGSSSAYAAFMDAIAGNSAAFSVKEQTTLTLGSAVLDIYPAEDPEEILDEKGEYDNDFSLVTRLQYGARSFLFCGDVEALRISQMLKSDTDWSCDWIKMPHHGAYDKSVKKLLEAAAPSYAVITDSDDEPADQKTISCLEKNDIEYAETADGTIVTSCDGENITMTVEP